MLMIGCNGNDTYGLQGRCDNDDASLNLNSLLFVESSCMLLKQQVYFYVMN
jgi:hypothetical protein